MAESRSIIAPNEIAHLEIECKGCGRATILPLNPPPLGTREPPGLYAFKRCLWCSSDFPPGLETALEQTRAALKFLAGNLPFAVRFVVKAAE